MNGDLLRQFGVGAFASLVLAALMVTEATLQFGGRSAATTVCVLAPVVWAAGLMWSGRRPKRG